MRRMDKKGADWKVIFTIILCLVVLGIILYGTVPAIRDFFKTGKELQACEGMGFAKGKCVSSISACTGTYFKGLGCSGATPLCCFGDEEEETNSSTNGTKNFADCNQHSVKLTEISFDPTPKLGEKFYVICYANEKDVPCMNAVKITSDREASDKNTGATCNLVPNQPTGTNRKLFECPLINTAGTYTFTCSLSDKGTSGKICCIEGEDETTINANKELSKSIPFE